MSVVARISGTTSPAEFVEKLRTAISQNKEPLERIRSTRAEQQASRSLREEQDSAYERSLAIDRERARQRREAEAARQREEQLAAERQAAEEKRLLNVEQWKRWRVQSIRDEPGADVKDVVRISIRPLSGDRVIRRFAPEADMEELYAFVECHDIMQEAETSEKSMSEKPDGYDHVYGFRLVSPMPRVVYEADAGSIRDKIGRGGTLLVEPIDDESDEED
jgi:FAS-associated factor 2